MYTSFLRSVAGCKIRERGDDIGIDFDWHHPRLTLSSKFHEWGEKYGPIYQVNLAGHNHIFLCRDAIAHDLMSKRSSIYSDRPFIPALEQDNRTSGQYLPLMSQNLLWSRQRRFAKVGRRFHV